MFSDEECGAVYVGSSWREGIQQQSAETQTSAVTRKERGVQAPKRKDAETSCDERELRMLDGQDDEDVYSGFDNWSASPAILRFLDSVTPLVEQALIDPKHNDAFEDLLASQSQKSGAQLLHLLTVDFQKIGLSHVVSEAMQLECTGVSWNATGTSVAASYGRRDIQGWCELPGVVCVWNLNSRNFKAAEPDYVLQHGSCLMCVACHPKKPALMAAGSYYGEVVVWDTARTEEPLVTCTRTGADTHSEPIAKITWAYDQRTRDYVLVSVGSEGNVITWSNKHDYSKPLSRITIPASVGELRNVARAGGATAAFTSHALGGQQMLLGTEGGRILRCSADDAIRNTAQIQPSFTQYQQHVGSVCSIAPSPFHRNLFLTVGTDGEIRLFNALDTSPIFNFEPSDASVGVAGDVRLHAAQFSPTKPGVFAVAASHQCIFLFDLFESDMLPVLTLRAPTDPRGVDVTSLAFNHCSSALLACCDNIGRVSIFQLGSKFTTASPREQQQIDQLARIYRSALS